MEYLDILNKDGRKTRESKPRKEVHPISEEEEIESIKREFEEEIGIGY